MDTLLSGHFGDAGGKVGDVEEVSEALVSQYQWIFTGAIRFVRCIRRELGRWDRVSFHE